MKLADLRFRPQWLDKNLRAHQIATLLLTFVIVPIYSILLVVLTLKFLPGGGLRTVQTSLSKLGWEHNHLEVPYLWGIVNLALYIYLLVLALNSCGFNKRAKQTLIGLTGASSVIMIVGVSIPFLPGDENYVPRLFHNILATTGFCLFAIVTIAMCVLLLLRNLKQGIGASALMAFIIITGVYSIPQVNSPDSNAFVTAAAQLYIFMMLEALLALIFLTQPLFDAAAAPKPSHAAEIDKQDEPQSSDAAELSNSSSAAAESDPESATQSSSEPSDMTES